MRYFENLRIGWIIEMVEIYGFINRDHVVKKFGVSPQVVSSDFAKVQKLQPHLMRYDTNAKCYFLVRDEDGRVTKSIGDHQP